LISTIGELKKRGCLRASQEMTMEEMLDSAEERQIGESEFMFEGGDDEIVSHAIELTMLYAAKNTLVEDKANESDNDEDINENVDTSSKLALSNAQIADLCATLGKACGNDPIIDGVDILLFQQQLLKLRGHFVRQQNASLQQSSLRAFFAPTVQ
jgi:hypothetical protein